MKKVSEESEGDPTRGRSVNGSIGKALEDERGKADIMGSAV